MCKEIRTSQVSWPSSWGSRPPQEHEELVQAWSRSKAIRSFFTGRPDYSVSRAASGGRVSAPGAGRAFTPSSREDKTNLVVGHLKEGGSCSLWQEGEAKYPKLFGVWQFLNCRQFLWPHDWQEKLSTRKFCIFLLLWGIAANKAADWIFMVHWVVDSWVSSLTYSLTHWFTEITSCNDAMLWSFLSGTCRETGCSVLQSQGLCCHFVSDWWGD